MNILVCCKQVPAGRTVTKPDTHALVREKIGLMINPADLNALEAAFSIKDKSSDDITITVMTMGKPAAAEILSLAASLGADRLYLLTDPLFSGSDTYATATVLSRAAALTGPYSLILCGNRSSDGDTGQVGAELAALLGLEVITQCSSIQMDGDGMICRRRLEQEEILLRAFFPAVVNIIPGFHTPRLPSISSLRRAKQLTVSVLNASDLDLTGLDCGFTGSPTKVTAVRPLPRRTRRQCTLKGIDGAAQTAAIIHQCKNHTLREAEIYETGTVDLL